MKIEYKDMERMDNAKIILAEMEENKAYSAREIASWFTEKWHCCGTLSSSNWIASIMKTAEKYGLIKRIYITEKTYENPLKKERQKTYAVMGYIKI